MSASTSSTPTPSTSERSQNARAFRDAEQWQRKQLEQREKRERQREQQLDRERAKREKQIAQQMREIDHHGEHMARTANGFAVLLLGAFSLASLLSLSLEAFTAFTAHLAHGQFDLPDALNILINILLVLCMDIAMFYAASVINALSNAGGTVREKAQHIAIMATACILEAATYIYLVAQYDRPTNPALWAIGIGRGLAAPLFSVYLSLARKLPIAPRDIAYYVSLLAGKGMIHDIGLLAGDRDAPLERKVAIYTSAATMSAEQRRRFEGIITAVNPSATVLTVSPEANPEAKRQEEPKPATPTTTPTPEPQRPAPVQFPTPQRQERPEREERQQPPALAPAALTTRLERTDSRPQQPERRPRAAARNTRRGLGRAFLTPEGDGAAAGAEQQERERSDRVELSARREAAARRILAETPDIGIRDLARRIAMSTQNKIGPTTARSLRDLILTEGLAEGEEEREGEQERRFHVVPTPPVVRVVDGSVEREDGEEERAEN